MRTKASILLAAFALSGWLLSGCYTQLARPNSEDEPQLTDDSASENQATDENYAEETTDTEGATNVYVYGGAYGPYWDPWWYYSPRSRFYVSIGFGYYDAWGWCGSPWNGWYEPWCRYGYYYSYPWPYHYYGGYPVYYPTYHTGTSIVDNRKRDFTRRGAKPGQNDFPPTAVANSPGDRNSLTKPVSATFARGEDGAYRRVRRDEASPTVRRSTNTTTSAQKPSGNARSSVRRSYKPPSNTGSVSRPSGSSRSAPRSSVSKPSGSRSTPKSSGASSGRSGSSGRRTKN